MRPTKSNNKKALRHEVRSVVQAFIHSKKRIDPHHAKLKEIADFLDVDYDLNKADTNFTMTDIKDRDKRIDNNIKESDKTIIEALFHFNKHSRKAAREICVKNQDYLKKQGIWETLLEKFKNHFEDE